MSITNQVIQDNSCETN